MYTVIDVPECSKGLGREWISIVGVLGTPRFHGNSSWEPYVAAVLSSLVNQVLQDGQVFAILGGEGKGPRCHSPLLDNPLQETMDSSTKMDEYSSLYGRILTSRMLDYVLCLKRTIKRDIMFKNQPRVQGPFPHLGRGGTK